MIYLRIIPQIPVPNLLELGRKTYIHDIRKTLITLELLNGFTSCKNHRVAREMGFPAPSAGKRLPAVIILLGGRKEADILQYFLQLNIGCREFRT